VCQTGESIRVRNYFSKQNIMTKFINLKSVLIALLLLTAVTAVVFYVVPQIFGDAPVAEACCGGDGGDNGGGGHDGPGGDSDPQRGSGSYTPAQCVSFTASPTSLPYGGGTVTLSWSTSNAQGVLIDGIGSVGVNGPRNVTVTSNTTFVLTAVGQGGTDTCTVSITVAPPPPPPPPAATCDSFTASPTSLPYGGGTVTLAWNTTNATAVSITGVGNVNADGSRSVAVTSNTTFTLTASGAGGNDTCTASVTVAPPTPTASCDAFTASPTSLPAGGGTVTLTWNTTNATSVSIDNGIGAVNADGSTSVTVTTDTTFTLTAVGTGGNDTCTASVTVQPPQNAAACDAFSASPNSFTNGTGGQVTLTWNTTNATSVSIDNGVGTVAADGSTTVTVSGDTTFTLTAVGAGGNDTCTAAVTVTSPGTLSCDSFSGSPSSLPRGGGTVTLSWNTTNADSVSIDNGVGTVAADGSTSVSVSDDITYTLTATRGTESVTCSTSISVDSGGGGGGGSSKPRCDLDVSDDKVKVGEKITLKWDTTRATEVTIEDNHGNEIFTTDDYTSREKKEFYDGEIDVIVYEDTEFTLLAERGSKERECEVEVEVEGEQVTVIEKRDQPLVAGIALTQVPYTGFEAGPMLTALFYILLVLWALFIAYILVIRKGSVLGFSLYADVAEEEATAKEEEFKKKVQHLAAQHSYQTLSPLR
jgi:hypothetical protein